MKALACGSCGDIQALQVGWRTCACGAISAHWVNPHTGTAEFKASETNKRYGFLLGLNNNLLVPALRGELAMFQDFRAAHEQATKAPNHIFDESRASCWAVVVRVGTTSDVTWVKEEPDGPND